MVVNQAIFHNDGLYLGLSRHARSRDHVRFHVMILFDDTLQHFSLPRWMCGRVDVWEGGCEGGWMGV